MMTALVLVDLQNDYFPDGAMPLVGIEAATRQAARALAHARLKGWSVVHIQHHSERPGATFFIPGTPGVEHHPAVAPANEEAVVVKHFPNAFRESALAAVLGVDDVSHLVICGAMSHMCIDATTRAAYDAGFHCTVLSDACATRDRAYNVEIVPSAQVHAAFMAALATPYAKVTSTDALLGE